MHFDGSYLPVGALVDLVGTADVVLLPYDSREQVTSGVLIEAVTAAKPVISTRFPHAVELLGDGAGLLIEPQRDPASIAAALRRVLTEPGLAARMSQARGRHRAAAAVAGRGGLYRDARVRAHQDPGGGHAMRSNAMRQRRMPALPRRSGIWSG